MFNSKVRNIMVSNKSFVHNSPFAAQSHSVFDTMTSTMVPLITTTDSSGNSWILTQRMLIQYWPLIWMHKLSIHYLYVSSSVHYFATATAAVVPALITVNVVTVMIILSLVVTIVFIVWCCIIKNRKIKSKLKQQ